MRDHGTSSKRKLTFVIDRFCCRNLSRFIKLCSKILEIVEIDDHCSPKSLDEVKLMLHNKEIYDREVHEAKIKHDEKIMALQKSHETNMLNKKRLYNKKLRSIISGELSSSEPSKKKRKP